MQQHILVFFGNSVSLKKKVYVETELLTQIHIWYRRYRHTILSANASTKKWIHCFLKKLNVLSAKQKFSKKIRVNLSTVRKLDI